MQNRWRDDEAKQFIAKYAGECGEDLALRVYSARLLGVDEKLVLHGGGNTSVKSTHTNLLGQQVSTIYIKASGRDMAAIEPDGFPGLELEYLGKLRALPNLSDERMLEEMLTHLLCAGAPAPSVETLVHAFLPHKFIDHTHSDAILTLTNQPKGADLVREALGGDVIVLPYVRPGFKLAQAVAAAYDANPRARGMVWIKHGIMTWAEAARQSYDAMIEFVSRAEEFIAAGTARVTAPAAVTSEVTALARVATVAPILRGLLAERTADADHPYRRIILEPLITRQVLDLADSARGREIAATPPLTSDHLIRTKAFPLWIEKPDYDDATKLREQLQAGVERYKSEYTAYVERHSGEIPEGLARLDSLPRVIFLPGLGALCAGKSAKAARIARDITAHTVAVKTCATAMGSYEGLPEDELFEMEYHTYQHAKLGPGGEPPLARHVALITGAAGAIGSGIAEGLLEQGCHVAVTDLAEDALTSLVRDLDSRFPGQVMCTGLDVTSPASVTAAFEAVIRTWGGVDLLVANAGIAMVSSLAEMKLEAFQRIERVNVEGTL
ncbi:MAG: SDR family NAD(P)-dependent oxidoreductase, partial [Acidobacteria bacterium]|nr:SDR family NAD(P)-dependent oxidoreductase [Acidobacteriota bacterium]